MWDFDFGRAVKAMVATLPFIILRLMVYFGITLAFMLMIGLGAGVGYGIGAVVSARSAGALLGGVIGFGIIGGLLYWAREYLLYLVKAGHVSVLVEYQDDKSLPGGKGQIDYAQGIVKERFKEMSILFGVDQLIKAILRAMNRLLFSFSSFLPISGVEKPLGVLQKILELSLTYTDELIIAYNVRTKSDNPWKSSVDAIILYAQNYPTMLKNAVFLMLFMYLSAFMIFLIFLTPAWIILAILPGSLGGWAFVLALLCAWSVKAAVLEPLAIAAMMQVYFKTIEGQEPKIEWEEKLSAVSTKFVEMKEKAKAYTAS